MLLLYQGIKRGSEGIFGTKIVPYAINSDFGETWPDSGEI
jgi:hypothetical protein